MSARIGGKPSHIPLFPDSYHKDTTHLTTEEHGAYLLLLMAAWGQDDCTLPYDAKRLAALAKLPVARWNKIAPTVLEFWTIEGGRIMQKRLRHEWEYVRAKSEKRKGAANARWSNERDANASGLHVQNGVTCNAPIGGGGGGGGVSLPTQGISSLEGVVPFTVRGAGK